MHAWSLEMLFLAFQNCMPRVKLTFSLQKWSSPNQFFDVSAPNFLCHVNALGVSHRFRIPIFGQEIDHIWEFLLLLLLLLWEGEVYKFQVWNVVPLVIDDFRNVRVMWSNGVGWENVWPSCWERSPLLIDLCPCSLSLPREKTPYMCVIVSCLALRNSLYNFPIVIVCSTESMSVLWSTNFEIQRSLTQVHSFL